MKRLYVWTALVIMVGLGAVIGTYETVPTHNTNVTHFDTIIVLGAPTDPYGRCSLEQRERVMEAVREFNAGRADHIIMSGGAAHNQWVEGKVMARVAVAAGVPAKDVFVDGEAKNTIENLFYSNRMMKKNGWMSAEVVSSPSHLPRVGLILEHYHFGWRTHASKWSYQYSWPRIVPYYLYEALRTTRLRWFGFKHSEYLPS